MQLVGKDSLAETDKLTLDVARIVREDYLQQNAYTPYDKYCPFEKAVWMLRNIVTFFDEATAAIEKSTAERKITMSLIKQQLGQLIYKVTSMKFQDPANGMPAIIEHMKALNDEIKTAFANLEE